MPKTTTPSRPAPDDERLDLIRMLARVTEAMAEHYKVCPEGTQAAPEELAALRSQLATAVRTTSRFVRDTSRFVRDTHRCCDYGRASNHDRLLSFESEGMAGVRYLIETMDLSCDGEADDDDLPWLELPDFIAQHNWQDPYSVYVLGGWIDAALRTRGRAA